MDASHLGEDVVADDGLVRGNTDAAIALYEAADVVQTVFADAGLGMELVFQNDLHAAERGVATALAQPVDGDVQSASTAQGSCQRVAHGQVVVVMGMEVEVRIGIAAQHLTEELDDLQGVHDAQRVGQHEAAHGCIDERIHELIDVLGRVLHAARPVFQVQVHADALVVGLAQRGLNVGNMSLGRLAQLLATVPQRALSQQVEGLAAGTLHPLHRLSVVDEAQHLDPVEHSHLVGIAAYHPDGLFFAFADACRRHFNAVDVEVAQQHSRYHELLVRQKRDAIGLLAVAKR